MNRRYGIALLLCLVNLICYADRTNIGIAISSFVDTKQERAFVLSSFFYGYLCTQILTGVLQKHFGSKVVLIAGVILWTLMDMSTVFVSHDIPLLCLMRALMGCGEGVVMPSLHRFAADWFPIHERSSLVSFLSSGSDGGTIVALLVSPVLKLHLGWPAIFLTFGLLSFAWIVVFSIYGASSPESCSYIHSREYRYILAHRETKQHTTRSRNKLSWRAFLTPAGAWGIYLSHASFNYGWYVLLSWLPQYLEEHLGLDLSSNELVAALPYVLGLCGVLVFGRVSDKLIASGMRTLVVRKLMNSIGLFGPALGLLRLGSVTNTTEAILILCLVLFSARASASGYWVNMLDVGSSEAGTLMGISNTFATIPGIVGNTVTGFILAHTENDWALVFQVAALVLIVGALAFLVLATDECIYDTRRQKEKQTHKRTTFEDENQNQELTPFLECPNEV